MQIKPIFITATNTDVGKTYTTLKLIDIFSSLGLRPVVYKPIETAVVTVPNDSLSLLQKAQSVNANLSHITTDMTTSFTFSLPAAPFVADSDKIIYTEKLKSDFENLKKYGDIVLIEGAGGLMTPITKELKMVDLATLFDASVLLVTSSQLGCINDTLLSIEALQNRQLSFEWCVNIQNDSFATITQPFYDALFPSWWSIEDGLEDFAKRYITL